MTEWTPDDTRRSHTSGRWFVKDARLIAVVDDPIVVVARVQAGMGTTNDEIIAANARLIAAAQINVTKVWRSWVWLTRACPPIARPVFQKKKPIYWLIRPK